MCWGPEWEEVPIPKVVKVKGTHATAHGMRSAQEKNAASTGGSRKWEAHRRGTQRVQAAAGSHRRGTRRVHSAATRSEKCTGQVRSKYRRWQEVRRAQERYIVSTGGGKNTQEHAAARERLQTLKRTRALQDQDALTRATVRRQGNEGKKQRHATCSVSSCKRWGLEGSWGGAQKQGGALGFCWGTNSLSCQHMVNHKVF